MIDYQTMVETLEGNFEEFFENFDEEQQKIIISQFEELLGYFDEFIKENEYKRFKGDE